MVHQGTTSQTLTSAIRLWLALLALAVLIGALVSAQTAMAQDAEPTCNPAGDDNDRLYCVWIAEPRFGGINVDDSDPTAIRVWLTGDEPAGDAADRVLAEVNLLWGRQFTSTSVDEADYTIGQLKGWFDLMVADPGDFIEAVDLSESTNRLILLVEDLETGAVTAVENQVSGLGVTTEAMFVQKVASTLIPPAPDPVPGARGASRSVSEPELISKQRLDRALEPFVGGGVIWSSGTGCTAAFAVEIVNLDGELERGVITSGHCGSGTWRAPGPDRRIGRSKWNLNSDGTDAQYIKQDRPELITMGVGYIARPIEKNTTGNAASQHLRRLDPANPYFEISGVGRSVVGEEIHKVGYTTGWTTGKVTDPCATWATNFPCTDATSAHHMSGDSGSPMFAIDADGRVSLRGILSSPNSRVIRSLAKLFHDRGVTEVRVTPHDYDRDDHGLLEVSNLAQLNAIRWDLDGDGSAAVAGYAEAFPLARSDMGCPTNGCVGYELAAGLDLDTDADGAEDSDDEYWNDGAGWEPIGSGDSSFHAVFEGNGHSVSNLFINRPNGTYIRLFGFGTLSTIRHVELQDVDITGQQSMAHTQAWLPPAMSGVSWEHNATVRSLVFAPRASMAHTPQRAGWSGQMMRWRR